MVMDPAELCLVHVQEILQNVLHFLPVVELLQKKQVCHAWKRSIENILKQRSKDESFDSQIFSTSEGPGCADRRLTSQNKRLKLSGDVDSKLCEFENNFLTWRKQWKQVPKFLILVYKSVNHNNTSFKFYDLLRKYLPKDCVVVMVRGTMCCRIDQVNVSWRAEALSFLSSQSNKINVMSWSNVNTAKDRKLLKSAIKTFSLCQKDLKMLLFFFNTQNPSMQNWVDVDFKQILKNDLMLGNNVVILGCALDNDVQISKNCSDHMLSLVGNQLKGKKRTRYDGSSKKVQFLAVAISGESVSTASVLVDETIHKISQLTSKLDILRSSIDVPPDKNSFGILVSCVDRMHNKFWYSDYIQSEGSVETHTFQQMFPSLPILAVHGYGEIGNNHNLNPPNLQNRAEFSHSQSAIFSVVSFAQ